MKNNTKNPRRRNLISTALICIVCILFLSFLLQGNTALKDKQDNSSRLNLDFLSSSSIPNVILWNTTWGGSGDDSAYDIGVDSLNNIYVAGRTTSFGAGGEDMVLVKYNSLGEQQWNTTWGGINDERAFMALDSSDNIILVGYTNSFGAGNQDIVLVKYNNLGEEQWNTTWGGINDEFSSSIVLDSSDNIILAGHTNNTVDGNSDIVLVKYNNLGEHQWNTTWGGSSGEGAYSIALDSSENIYITGFTKSFGAGSLDMVLIKYNNLGERQWNTTWGGSGLEYGSGISFDSSNSIYLVGVTNSFGAGSIDITLVKYNTLGELQWNTTWGGSSGDGTWDGIVLDSSGNIFLAGYTGSFGAEGRDIILVKYNNLGEHQWNATWGGSGDDYGEALAFDSSENIYITGYTKSFGAGNEDIVLIKYAKAPSSPILTIITSSPTVNLDINLTWTTSPGADNYTLYRHTSQITSSNLNSATEVKTVTGTSTTDTVPVPGRWYYAIVANNETGSSCPSNSPYIDVQEPISDGIPGYPLIYLYLFSLIGVLIILYRKILKINTNN